MEDRIGGNRTDFGGKAEFVPAAAVLVGVGVFWLAGFLGGLAVLHSPAGMISVLMWLYIMLAAVALSVVAAALAIFDISRRLKRRRRGWE